MLQFNFIYKQIDFIIFLGNKALIIIYKSIKILEFIKKKRKNHLKRFQRNMSNKKRRKEKKIIIVFTKIFQFDFYYLFILRKEFL